MNERERAETEIINFAASQWTMIIVDDLELSRSDRDQLIILAASYGPPKQ